MTNAEFRKGDRVSWQSHGPENVDGVNGEGAVSSGDR
jgi:hypothetical protein